MKTLLARRAVLLSLGLILMATVPTSNGQLGGGGGGGGLLGGGGGGGGGLLGGGGGGVGGVDVGFTPLSGGGSAPASPSVGTPGLRNIPFGGSLVPVLVGSLPGPRPTPPSSSPSSSPPMTTSTPPTTPTSTPPTSSPAATPCPLTTAQCNFPACSQIPGCQQCNTNPSGNGIICIRCCTGFALRATGNGLICDACSAVSNCRTCDPIAGANAAPFVRCTACCPGFGLDTQAVAPALPEPECDPCNGVTNACTACIDGNQAAPNGLLCTTCAAGFRLSGNACVTN